MQRSTLLTLLLFVAASAELAQAHHSFAVFFDDKKIIEVTGAITEFHFTNPHGIIELSVKNANGQMESWKAETNAPVLLRRRGWTKDSLKAGEVVTVEGWIARDGSHYLRMRKVTKSDGTILGAAVANSVSPSSEQR